MSFLTCVLFSHSKPPLAAWTNAVPFNLPHTAASLEVLFAAMVAATGRCWCSNSRSRGRLRSSLAGPVCCLLAAGASSKALSDAGRLAMVGFRAACAKKASEFNLINQASIIITMILCIYKYIHLCTCTSSYISICLDIITITTISIPRY